MSTRPKTPFPAGAGPWLPQTKTPWYSMTRKGSWFRVEPTNGLDPVSVMVIDGEDRVLLVETYRPALDRICLETPRGFTDEGETPRMAAARELAEEAGLLAAPGDLVDLGRIAVDSGILSTRVHLFGLRLDFSFGTFAEGDGEILSRRLVARAELETMIESGEMEDGIVAMSLRRLLAGGCPSNDAGILRLIEIVSPDGEVVTQIETARPDWSFEQYCRNRETAGFHWRFKSA